MVRKAITASALSRKLSWTRSKKGTPTCVYIPCFNATVSTTSRSSWWFFSRPSHDSACGARVRMNEIRAPGSDGTSASVTTRPQLFKTQTEVFRSETSKATYWSTTSLPGLATTPNLVGIHLGRKASAKIGEAHPAPGADLRHMRRRTRIHPPDGRRNRYPLSSAEGVLQHNPSIRAIRSLTTNVCSGSGRRARAEYSQSAAIAHSGVYSCLTCAPASIATNSACASAISGISGVGAKPSSAGARTACASAGRSVD